jgi:hypothetical protein
MTRFTRLGALIAGGALLLTGCATARTSQHARSGPAMSPGMIMPDGSTMGAADPTVQAAADGPSAAEKMICAAETRTTITSILGQKTAPQATATWRDQRYACTYRLPVGTLVLSVQRSTNPTTARAYFASLRHTLGSTQPLDGLGQGAYGTPTGTVVLIKDSDTLTVDATRLPAVFGTQHSKRFDFAYELASDILGCWTGG